ncbi:MAG: hypothetical protein NT151_13415 [Acidobacteria bacterium]|nr:hypothetical protein [Acidobacteriota bacterium]
MLVAVSWCTSAALKPVQAAAAQQAVVATPKAAAAPQAAAAPAQAAASAARVFTGDVGMMFNVIKPDRAEDFEKVIANLKDALAASKDPVHKAMAKGWRVYKSTEPIASGNILYVFVIDPVVKGADYSPSKILNDVFPEKVQELFKIYSASFAGGVTLQNHKLVADMKPVDPKPPDKK